MLPAVVHRKWAREFLDRAQSADSRTGKLKYLRLAVDNTLRAQTVEHDNDSQEYQTDGSKPWAAVPAKIPED